MLEKVGEFLPGDIIRNMISEFQKFYEEEDEDSQFDYEIKIDLLARQLKDGEFYEKILSSRFEELPISAIIHLAEVYFESGKFEKSIAWLKKIPETELYKSEKRNDLLIENYKKLGDKENLIKTLKRKFESLPSKSSLDALIEETGEDYKEEAISKVIEQIMNRIVFLDTDIQFLIDIEELDVVEEYLIKRIDELPSVHYQTLTKIAKEMLSRDRKFAACLAYRALLLSILERGASKYYPIGIGYLKKLNSLSEEISDWKNLLTHDEFKLKLREVHGLKKSFWSRYSK